MDLEATARYHTVCPLSGWVKHQMREALKQAVLVKPCEKKDMAGIENGVEYKHAVAILTSKELSAEDQELLKRILQGNMYTNDRTSHTKIRDARKRWETIAAGMIRK